MSFVLPARVNGDNVNLTLLLCDGNGEAIAHRTSHICSYSLPVLEDLSEALLDFTSVADLQAWLETR